MSRKIYHQNNNNTTHRPKIAFIACEDSPDTIAKVESCGVASPTLLLLSRKDLPPACTPDDILSALPSSIRLVFLDRVEHLLPMGARDTDGVRQFLKNLKKRPGWRDLHVYSVAGSLAVPVVSVELVP